MMWEQEGASCVWGSEETGGLGRCWKRGALVLPNLPLLVFLKVFRGRHPCARVCGGPFPRGTCQFLSLMRGSGLLGPRSCLSECSGVTAAPVLSSAPTCRSLCFLSCVLAGAGLAHSSVLQNKTQWGTRRESHSYEQNLKHIHSPCFSCATRHEARHFCGFYLLILKITLEAKRVLIPILQAGTTTAEAQGDEVAGLSPRGW